MKQANIISACACGGSGELIRIDAGFYVKCENAPRWYTPPIYCTEKKAIRCWNDMQKDMDDLTRDAMVAAHRGISYGEYIPIKEQLPEEDIQELAHTTDSKKCMICGEEIPSGSYRTKYCSATCADIALDICRKKYHKRTGR